MQTEGLRQQARFWRIVGGRFGLEGSARRGNWPIRTARNGSIWRDKRGRGRVGRRRLLWNGKPPTVPTLRACRVSFVWKVCENAGRFPRATTRLQGEHDPWSAFLVGREDSCCVQCPWPFRPPVRDPPHLVPADSPRPHARDTQHVQRGREAGAATLHRANQMHRGLSPGGRRCQSSGMPVSQRPDNASRLLLRALPAERGTDCCGSVSTEKCSNNINRVGCGAALVEPLCLRLFSFCGLVGLIDWQFLAPSASSTSTPSSSKSLSQFVLYVRTRAFCRSLSDAPLALSGSLPLCAVSLAGPS